MIKHSKAFNLNLFMRLTVQKPMNLKKDENWRFEPRTPFLTPKSELFRLLLEHDHCLTRLRQLTSFAHHEQNLRQPCCGCSVPHGARCFATMNGSAPKNMDCYAVLKVKFNASDAEVKNSYYALAKLYHPDQSSNVSEDIKKINKEKFQRVQSAYEVLSDPERKAKYDAAYAARFNKMAAVMNKYNINNNSGPRQQDWENYKAESEWSYTYDSKGNKRRNYTDTNSSRADSAETPGDARRAWNDAKRTGRSGSPGSRQRTHSQSYYSHQSGAQYSTASYGQHQYQSGNDQLFKFGLGTFGVMALATGLVADVMTRDQGGEKQLTAHTYHGFNQKGMVNNVANEFRVDAMRAASQGMTSNYSPQISKTNYQSKDDLKILLGTNDKQHGGTKSKKEFEAQFKSKKKEQASIQKSEQMQKEKEERLKHIQDNKVEKIQEIHYVKHCEQCQEKKELEDKIVALEAKLRQFDQQNNVIEPVDGRIQRSKSLNLDKPANPPVKQTEKKVIRYRSLGTQTFIDANNIGSTDLGIDNPFYKGEDDDDEEYDRTSALHLSTLSTAHGQAVTPSGGTIAKQSQKRKKSKSKVTADCFKPETIGIHKNKGGDGFEAWKGNRRIIKKAKIGVHKIEQKVVPREGQYVQPWNFQTGLSK